MAEKTSITIAIMSPGDMGHSIGKALLSSNENKLRVITNLTGRSARTKKLSDSAGIIDVQTDEELVRQADFIFSIIVPSEAFSLAQRFAPYLNENQDIIYVDMNAIAPQTIGSLGQCFQHGNFVDGCIIGFPPGFSNDVTTIYLSGEYAQNVADLFQHTSLIKAKAIGNKTGQASSLKMCYASINKGIGAIAIQACTTAKIYGVEELLFDELKYRSEHLYDKLNKFIPHIPPRASRWVGEMEEIAKTFEHVGLSEKTFHGAAETYRFIAEKTPLGSEIIEERKRGKTLTDVMEIMAESLKI